MTLTEANDRLFDLAQKAVDLQHEITRFRNELKSGEWLASRSLSIAITQVETAELWIVRASSNMADND